ncbi:RrF2 family transcriptional regulator [Telmatobacter bradus]|uniref:RrF2 family transcriptional regulator n=1 Tax=Telmatobacter bradus TaxID=474953 RepID=UPI003B43BBC6
MEYALHCLLYLVAPEGERVEANVRDLALLQGVSVEYLAKIFTRLSKAGLVTAAEGARGGYALARTAEEISFLDVVHAIDGPKELFECREIRSRCAVFGSEAPAWAISGRCSIHTVMLMAEDRMRMELAEHSLAELAGQVAKKAPTDFALQIGSWFDDRKPTRRGN